MPRLIPLFANLALCACQSAPTHDPPVGASTSSHAASIDTQALRLPGTWSELATRADFEARFGAANVRLVEARDGDAVSRSLVLFADDPRRRATVRFHDDRALALLAAIEVRDADSLWRGKHGVRVGMTLAEVRRINGKPFHLSGFDAEKRARARDQWSPALDDADDRLGALDVDGDDRLYFGVDFALGPAAADGDWPRDEYFSSDDPRWPALGDALVVSAFTAWSSLDDEWQ
ncbi:MAG: hypothetical protein J0L88_03535 [Xanthomonadales bacterium]|nr:hypothetical protein [Xanthomonadales bacterium]